MKNAYMGIDVSKGYADFALLDESKEMIESGFQLDDTYLGHDALRSIITSYFIQGKINCLYCAVESTGGYENNWFGLLKEIGLKHEIVVARLNPRGVKGQGDASLTRTVTDGVSARNIAEYLMNYPKNVNYNETDNLYTSLRNLLKTIKMLKKQKTQLCNQLEKILYSAFPEVLSYCKNSFPNWLLKILAQHPTPSSIDCLDESGTINFLGLDPKAGGLLTKAKKSIARRGDAFIGETVKLLAKEILSKGEIIDRQKEVLANNFTDPRKEMLTKMKGIGNYSAAVLLLEIEDVNRFVNSKKICAYYGVEPIYKQSGDGSWGHHMSKRGRSAVREALYMIALTAIQHEPHIKEIYQRHLDDGKNHYFAIGVCMHKILRIIYGILKNNCPYDPEVDKSRITKSIKNKGETKTISGCKERRHQKIDINAPVSGRKYKKIKEQLEAPNP